MFEELIFFAIGFGLSWIFTGSNKNKQPPIFSNLILTKRDCNGCIHIHHWFLYGFLCIIYYLLNLIVLNKKWDRKYVYILALYLGSFISEYIKFGNDIFVFNIKCCYN